MPAHRDGTRVTSFTTEDLRGILHDGETIVAQGDAEMPLAPRRTIPVGIFTLLSFLMERSRYSDDVTRLIDETAGTRFPLDFAMALVLTSERLLTWSADLCPEGPDDLLADLPLWQIKYITTSYEPPGPKSDVRITLQYGTVAVVRVDTVLADILVTQFRRQAK